MAPLPSAPTATCTWRPATAAAVATASTTPRISGRCSASCCASTRSAAAATRSPPGNPFTDSPARDEIYANGLRNPFRFSFDAATGTILIGDVGQGNWEEVDYETLRGARGANFGWNTFEGNHDANCGSDRGTPTAAEHSGPIHEYPHDGNGHSGCSITGGVVVRDKQLPSLYGRYVYADFCTGDLRSLIPDLGGAGDEKSAGVRLANPTSFFSGRRGRLYATSQRGELYRVVADGGARTRSQ